MVYSFGPNWVYTMNKGPKAIAHGFSNGLIQKVRYHEVLSAMVQALECKSPLVVGQIFFF
jgi:hypothetical protein